MDKAKGEKVIDKQVTVLSKELAVLVGEQDAASKLDAVNQGLGNLPIVMGRNISTRE